MLYRDHAQYSFSNNRPARSPFGLRQWNLFVLWFQAPYQASSRRFHGSSLIIKIPARSVGCCWVGMLPSCGQFLCSPVSAELGTKSVYCCVSKVLGIYNVLQYVSSLTCSIMQLSQYKISTAHAVNRPTRLAASRLTRLLVKKEWPLMCTTSGPSLLVTFCVTLLKPVNWTVAPRTESIKEPSSPAAAPAQSHWNWIAWNLSCQKQHPPITPDQSRCEMHAVTLFQSLFSTNMHADHHKQDCLPHTVCFHHCNSLFY